MSLKWLIVILMFGSLQVLAQDVKVNILSRIETDLYSVGIGSPAQIDMGSRRGKVNSLFLGRMEINERNAHPEYLFLDLNKTRIYMINSENVQMNVSKAKVQKLARPIDQTGSTCAAYGIYHFWLQMHQVGFSGTTFFNSSLSTERGRMKLLEESIERYYISQNFNFLPIMKRYGERFGFTCKAYVFDDSKEAVSFIFKTNQTGHPVLMEFSIGPKMITSSYEVVDFEKPVSPDARLWIPRKFGERNSGGHSIVAAASFVANSRKKTLILDSDWSEPRIWDLAKYFSADTDIQDMTFYSCR